ncbi:MAG: alkaline phosphatase [Bacteroidota bacterium]
MLPLFLSGCMASKAWRPKVEKPKKVILMIGDGMGLGQVTAALYSTPRFRLNLERFPVIGLIKTHAVDNLITDSAAGATAFASGCKTYLGAIGVNRDTISTRTIFEIAQKKGIRTGLVVTSEITHATPACFYAHQPLRTMYEQIAEDFATSKVDLAIGGGKKYFLHRYDRQNLIEVMEGKNIRVLDEEPKWRQIDYGPNERLVCFTANMQPKRKVKGRHYLAPATSFAMNFLDKGAENGFMLLVEGSQIDWGGHANDSNYIISETLDFDKAIGKVLDFAQKDGETLVVVTADHETGGYSVKNGSRRGNLKTGFTTGSHTATMVPVYAFGPGSEKFAGIYNNTEIFDKVRNALGI